MQSIMVSKRGSCYVLERARVMVKDGCVVYADKSGSNSTDALFNIPDLNTYLVLLGQGTSITNSAVRMLAQSGVMIGFTGTGGSPLFASTDIEFLSPQSEYRPTEYMQKWCSFWFDDDARLQAAKMLMEMRLNLVKKLWATDSFLLGAGVQIEKDSFQSTLASVQSAKSNEEMLLIEARWAKNLYAILSKGYSTGFKRNHGRGSHQTIEDTVNAFLDHGNYLAYGISAVTLNTLGISFAMPILHGKTRRGGLVFDLADLIKDAVVMPCAFELGSEQESPQTFRQTLIDRFSDYDCLDLLFEAAKSLAESSKTFIENSKFS